MSAAKLRCRSPEIEARQNPHPSHTALRVRHPERLNSQAANRGGLALPGNQRWQRYTAKSAPFAATQRASALGTPMRTAQWMRQPAPSATIKS